MQNPNVHRLAYRRSYLWTFVTSTLCALPPHGASLHQSCSSEALPSLPTIVSDVVLVAFLALALHKMSFYTGHWNPKKTRQLLVLCFPVMMSSEMIELIVFSGSLRPVSTSTNRWINWCSWLTHQLMFWKYFGTLVSCCNDAPYQGLGRFVVWRDGLVT